MACEVCEGNYKLFVDNVTCTYMACKVPNCDVCVTENDTLCETCGTGYALGEAGCSAGNASSTLPLVTIVGIAVGGVGGSP
ncbi:hypothetical protein STCU_12032 [Strigomonas culicis]|uniref:Surface antigen-like protein n=1 Tax=Strigomonas culicis TaxID=28005 RepID=S9TBM6_9TRYP|nr:hypothetical protein STCU_12032 [Strigomonas culicis]|eukprot:EPY15427.1 hypothetical protein STCU_12032 [Strigomonas culicis]